MTHKSAIHLLYAVQFYIRPVPHGIIAPLFYKYISDVTWSFDRDHDYFQSLWNAHYEPVGDLLRVK